jgi:hypothetical protein
LHKIKITLIINKIVFLDNNNNSNNNNYNNNKLIKIGALRANLATQALAYLDLISHKIYFNRINNNNVYKIIIFKIKVNNKRILFTNRIIK